MKTPNVYCATCSLPLGTGNQRTRYFCGEVCERLFPGKLAARNALICSLVFSGAYDVRETAAMFKITRQRVEQVLRGE